MCWGTVGLSTPTTPPRHSDAERCMWGRKTHPNTERKVCLRVFFFRALQWKCWEKNWFQTGFYVSQHVQMGVFFCINTAISTVYSKQGPPATITAQKLLPLIWKEKNAEGWAPDDVLESRSERQSCGAHTAEQSIVFLWNVSGFVWGCFTDTHDTLCYY